MPAPLRAFAGYGIELEYAIVARDSLDVQPCADALLAALADAAFEGGAPAPPRTPVNDVQRGSLGWSNELVAHVVELKNVAPAASLAGLAAHFDAEIAEANAALARGGAALLPGGMHPWMDPARETVLWPHEGREIYQAFDRIFDCRRHGWANLQSMHINLPFGDDAELARLHAAARAVLPLVPALAASSPFVAGRRAGELDHRLAVYRTNSAAIPCITGDVVPDDVADGEDYRQRVLAPIYAAIAPHDPAGVLRHEWLNARGAIVRFDRQAIELRLCDTQERPAADVAVAAAVAGTVRLLYEERWAELSLLRAQTTAGLAAILADCVREGEAARIDDASFCALFGVAAPVRAGVLWEHAIDAGREAVLAIDPDAMGPLALIATHGTLARRLVRAVGDAPPREALRLAYARLRDCLAHDAAFLP